jgi:hypothetical protein
MALSTALYTVLRLNADIVTTFSTRIYAGVAPHDTNLPCIVYEINNITPTTAKDSYKGFDACNITVTVVGVKHSDVETYSGYVRTALEGYTGTQSSEKISSVAYESQSAGYDPEWTYGAAAEGAGVFTRTLNFTLYRTQ